MNYYKIITHKGDTLILIEVPLDAYDFEIIDTIADIFLFYIVGKERIRANYRTFDLQNNKYEIIGTTSTLTDEQVNNLIKDFTYTKGMSGDVWFKCDTLNEFLEANNIDTTKNYCILKILKNE